LNVYFLKIFGFNLKFIVVSGVECPHTIQETVPFVKNHIQGSCKYCVMLTVSVKTPH